MPRKYKRKTTRAHGISDKPKTLPARFKPGCLSEVDQRTALAKTLQANFKAILDDIGGIDESSHIKKALVERFVFMECLLKTLEHEIASGELSVEAALGRWTQSVNALVGLARSLGLEKASGNRPWVVVQNQQEDK